MAARAPADTEPIAGCDPLLAHTLRAALESYIRGDYHAALDRLKDARALGGRRADYAPFVSLENLLQFGVDIGVLVSHELPRRAAEDLL